MRTCSCKLCYMEPSLPVLAARSPKRTAAHNKQRNELPAEGPAPLDSHLIPSAFPSDQALWQPCCAHLTTSYLSLVCCSLGAT